MNDNDKTPREKMRAEIEINALMAAWFHDSSGVNEFAEVVKSYRKVDDELVQEVLRELTR